MPVGTQTIVSGARDTERVGTTSLHVREVDNQIRLLQPYPTPIDNFFMINEKFTTEVTTGKRSKFEWYEDKFLPSILTLAAAITGGSPTETITITNHSLRVRDLILVEATGQILQVTSVTTSTAAVKTLTGNITAAAVNTLVQRLAPAYAETDGKGTSLTVVAVNKTGYCQILKRLLAITNRQSASEVYGGNDWNYQWRKALMEIREEWERTMLNNGAATDDSTTLITYSAGFGSLTTNKISYTGAISKATWDAAIKQCFVNGSTFELDAYCGGDALMDIAAFITNLLTIHQTSAKLSVSQFGLMSSTPTDTKLVDYIHPMGVVHIYFNPQLRSTNATHVVFVNRENIKKRYMGNDITGKSRKYRIEMGIQAIGDDSFSSQYLFDQGLQILLEETHGRLYK